MINYMDRLTLNQTAKRIKDELQLNNQGYGEIEFGFGVAFAFGALFMGWSVDRWNVRWLYPIALFGWSASGFATGFASSFTQLFACRVALGFFESGNWPCALRTTQRILRPAERTLGNSILQSGAAIGAVLTPLIVVQLVTGPGTWPYPFFVIGILGTGWVVLWLVSVRRQDLSFRPESRLASAEENDVDKASPPKFVSLIETVVKETRSFARVLRNRRFWVLVVLVVGINLTWHFFRVWLPLFLQEHHGYAEQTVQWFSTVYYMATDAGSLTAGFSALWLARKGISVHNSRVAVFGVCSLLTLLSLAVAYIEAGPLLIGLLLLLGFGALGLFPVYYSLSQDLTVQHQGKLTGTLGFTTWMVSAAMHPIVGAWLDQTKDWSRALALAGLPPVAGLIVLTVLWGPVRLHTAESMVGECETLDRTGLSSDVIEDASDKIRGQ
jgi:ACS family hexuronate transporter-like MFS transporter